MDLAHLALPELHDLLAKLDEQDANALLGGKHFLPDEVRAADLRRMSDANLEGRYHYYLKDYTFELNRRRREEFYREVVRTKYEIQRRAHERREAAAAEVIADLTTEKRAA